MEKILSKIRQTPRELILGLEKFSNHKPFLYSIPMALNILKGKKAYAIELLERVADSAKFAIWISIIGSFLITLLMSPAFTETKNN